MVFMRRTENAYAARCIKPSDLGAALWRLLTESLLDAASRLSACKRISASLIHTYYGGTVLWHMFSLSTSPTTLSAII